MMPKKDSHLRQVIMDPILPHSSSISINGSTQKDTYLGVPWKMHLPSAQDIVHLIKQTGKNCYLFCCDISHAYRQLQLDPSDWHRVCPNAQGCHYMDISLLFDLHWVAACYQGVNSLIARHLGRQRLKLLSYIDDLGVGVASSKDGATQHFDMMCTSIRCLGLTRGCAQGQ